jgi:hypothetical protein
MADQVMRVDGDFKGYVSAAAKAEKATKNISKEAKEIANAVKKAEERTLKMAEGFSKAAIPAMALGASLAQAVSLMNKLRDRDMGASERGGARESALVNTANKLGLSNVFGLKKEVADRTGGATLEGLTAFMSGLGDYNEDAKVPLSGTDAESLVSGYNKGGDAVFGENGRNIIRKLAKGESPQSILKAAGSSKLLATPESIQAAFLRNKEDAALLAEENLATRPTGTSPLSEGAAARLYNAENRGAAVGQNWMDRMAHEYFPDMYQQKVDETLGDYKTKYDGAAQWQALKAITDATRQSNSSPNGKTEAP